MQNDHQLQVCLIHALINKELSSVLLYHQELNELIKLTYDIGLESRDIFEIISLMRKLGGEGFRKLINYGGDHSSDFIKAGKGLNSGGSLKTGEDYLGATL